MASIPSIRRNGAGARPGPGARTSAPRPAARRNAAGRAVGPRRARRTGLLMTFFTALIGAAALVGVGTTAIYAYFSRDLPSPENIAQRHQFHTTKIYDRNGVLLHEVYDPDKGRRTAVPLAEIPEPVKDAFLAAEDARFYENAGIDLQAIVRASWTNVTDRGSGLVGGSTITQQLIKNTLLTDERSLSRKIREAILAIGLSRRYSKDQILEMYLNTVFLGNQAFGVQAAAETYFGKPVKELSQAEAALLAGLPRSPSATNPFRDEQAAKAEQQRVLAQMVHHRMLSQDQASQIEAEPLAYNKQQFADIKAPHFVIWVREQLEANPKYGRQGLYERGLEIKTTIDIRMQEMAELIVRDHVAGLGRFNVRDGALVALNPATGEILAMVGSADYHNKEIQGEVNVALALRQPGSSIKPITYLTAFQKGWAAATIIDDKEETFPGNPPYRPRNYDGRFHGKITVRTALANSYNIPAVKALEFVGVPAMIEQARKMGITSFRDPQRYGLSLTLGGGEVRLLDLTAAYGVLANGGKYAAPVSILEVKDTQGKVLDAYVGPRAQPATDPARAYLLTSILSDNEARTPGFGPNSPLKLSRPVAVKTGTTDDFKDNWTVGYTPQLVTGVWVGNADNTAMRGTTGLTGAAPIWHDFMEYALKPLPVDPLAPPPGLEKAAVSRESGRLWVEGCPEPKIEDLFPVGALPTEKCEAPTPTPTYTPPPATSTPVASATPQRSERQESSPTADTLRARLAETATAAAAEAATRVARSQPPGRGSTPAPTAQASAQPRSEATRPPAAPAAAATATTRPAAPTAAPTRANLLDAIRATATARRDRRD